MMLHLELGKLGHLVAADTLPDTKAEYWHRKNNPTHGFCVSLRQTQSTIPKGRGCISTHISLNTIHSTLLKWVRKSLSGKACTSCLEKMASITYIPDDFQIYGSTTRLPKERFLAGALTQLPEVWLLKSKSFIQGFRGKMRLLHSSPPVGKQIQQS